MKYRPEIDGLRTLAVVPVILFHAGFSVFSGGYVGVDVFFVISGYLITTILISEREAGTYSIWGFYERRARRILPALFLVMFCAFPFAWYWIPPGPFEDYANSQAYAALFLSNVHFIENSGYFDVDSELRPLLHTWSLAVEEQYYLLFPLVLMMLGGFARDKFLWVFLALSALSLALAEWGWRNYPTENFFFSPSRLWELLAGSICAALLFGRDRPGSEVFSMAGLALILYSIFVFDAEVPFPSLYTLVPVLGTALIILYAGRETMVARLLSLRAMVGIGLISYSAYLWHQPLFAFARLRSIEEPSIWLMGALVPVTLVLAFLSWKYVEGPFRTKAVLPARRPLLAASVVGIIAFSSIGFWGEESGGFPSRLEGKVNGDIASLMEQIWVQRPDDLCKDQKKMLAEHLCVVHAAEDPVSTVAVLGDSHANSIMPALTELAKTRNMTLMRATRAACPPMLGVYLAKGDVESDLCHQMLQTTSEQVVASDVDTVFIVARWSLYAKGDLSRIARRFMISQKPDDRSQSDEDWNVSYEVGVRNMVKFYRDAGLRVVLLSQVPQQVAVPENVLGKAALLGLDIETARAEMKESFIDQDLHKHLVRFSEGVLARVAAEQGAEIISVNSFFEEGDRYAWFRGDQLYYNDGDHLSITGAQSIAPLIGARLGLPEISGN